MSGERQPTTERAYKDGWEAFIKGLDENNYLSPGAVFALSDRVNPHAFRLDSNDSHLRAAWAEGYQDCFNAYYKRARMNWGG